MGSQKRKQVADKGGQASEKRGAGQRTDKQGQRTDKQAPQHGRAGERAAGGGGKADRGVSQKPSRRPGQGGGGREREREGREGSRERRGREEGKRPEGRGARCAVGERTLEPTTVQRAGARRSQERRSRQPARSIGPTIRTVRAQGARKVPQVASLRLSLVPVPFDATGG